MASPADRAGEIRRALEGQRFGSVAEIVVCEGDRLVGLVNVEDLLAATDDQTAGELMDADPPVAAPGVDQEVAAWRAVEHKESSLAIVDADRRFLGLIPPRRLLEVLLVEHEEDLARLAGFARGVSSARLASEEPISRRLAHRLPWLLVGLAGALLAAVIVGSFEAQLEAV
jgi:magnesium transporter